MEEEKERRVCPSKDKHDAKPTRGKLPYFHQKTDYEQLGYFERVLSVDQPGKDAA